MEFRDTNGVLAVDMKVRDTNHAQLFVQTLSDPSYVITNVDGRPNTTWFTFVFADQLPIDNSKFERITPVVSELASGSIFPVGNNDSNEHHGRQLREHQPDLHGDG